jgi:hypothetical protein
MYDEEWAEEVFAWSWEREGDVMRVEGLCPRCKHEMSREIEHAPTALRRLTTDPGEGTVWITIRCNCTGSHPGRPEREDNGCGRFARVKLPLP